MGYQVDYKACLNRVKDKVEVKLKENVLSLNEIQNLFESFNLNESTREFRKRYSKDSKSPKDLGLGSTAGKNTRFYPASCVIEYFSDAYGMTLSKQEFSQYIAEGYATLKPSQFI